MRREGLPGVPEFKGKIKPKESKVTRREFKNSPDDKFDRDNSLVGNVGDMEADVAEKKEWDTKSDEAKTKEAELVAKARAELAKISDKEVDVALDDLEEKEPEDLTHLVRRVG